MSYACSYEYLSSYFPRINLNVRLLGQRVGKFFLLKSFELHHHIFLYKAKNKMKQNTYPQKYERAISHHVTNAG